jgi:7-carboxy-7-deazaguanine synthase
MVSSSHTIEFRRFMEAAESKVADRAVLKIVCFDDADFEWATETAARHPELPLYLSAGTPVPAPPGLRDAVGERYRWLCERVAETPALGHARVLPQLHVIAWKDATGV